jgi:hypothetical protein
MGTLNPGDRRTTVIDTSIQMKLPVDVTANRTSFGGNLDKDTPYSRVEFNWPALECAEKLREHYKLNLSEGKLWITCGVPCPATSTVTATTQSENTTTKNSEATTGIKTQPGLEAWIAIGGLIAMTYLRRSKRVN